MPIPTDPERFKRVARMDIEQDPFLLTILQCMIDDDICLEHSKNMETDWHPLVMRPAPGSEKKGGLAHCPTCAALYNQAPGSVFTYSIEDLQMDHANGYIRGGVLR